MQLHYNRRVYGAPAVIPRFCREKAALAKTYYAAVREMIGLQMREFEASAENYYLMMGQARLKVDTARDRYIHHVRTHGC